MNKRSIFFPDATSPAQVSCAVYLIYLSFAVQVIASILDSISYILSAERLISLGNFLAGLALNAFFILVALFITTQIAAGKNWARYLFLLVTILATVLTMSSLLLLLTGDPVFGVSLVSQLVMNVLASALLFQKASGAWFNQKNGSAARFIESQNEESKPDPIMR